MKTLDPIIKNYEKKLDELAGLSWGGASGVSTADIPDLSRTRECFDGDMYLLDNPTVKEVIRRGLVADAWDHWIKFGRTQRRFARFIPYNDVLNDRNLGRDIYILADNSVIGTLSGDLFGILKNQITILCEPTPSFEAPSYLICSNKRELMVSSKFLENTSSPIYLRPIKEPYENFDILNFPNINLNFEQAFNKRSLPKYLTNFASPIYGEAKALAALHLAFVIGARRIIVSGKIDKLVEGTGEEKYIKGILSYLKQSHVQILSTEKSGVLCRQGATPIVLESELKSEAVSGSNILLSKKVHLVNEGYGDSSFLISRAEGQKVFDKDGTPYIDTAMAAGGAILGHSNPLINATISSALGFGLVYGRPNIAGNNFGELLHSIFPWFSKFAIANTGSEATMRLIRIVRNFTNRKKIGVFAGSWHGTNDFLLVDDDQSAPESHPKASLRSSGSPEELLGLITLLPHNNEAAFDIIVENREELAAVLCEPIQGSNPKPSDVEFVRKLRDVTKKNGVLLAFDEVITGGRLGLSGFQEKFNIFADIAAYGKIFGGGLPIGFVGGREDIMSTVIDPQVRGANKASSGNVILGGTFSANPLVIASAIKTIELLKANNSVVYPYIDGLSELMRQEINDFCKNNNIAARMYGVGSISRLLMTDRPVRSARHRDELEPSIDVQAAFYKDVLELGIHVGNNRLMFISTEHERQDITNIVSVFTTVLSKFSSELAK